MKTKPQAEQEAREIVNKWAATAALGGWIPGSTLAFSAADVVMVNQVAKTFAVHISDPRSILASVAGGLGATVAGSVIAEGVGIIPVFGWAVKSGMMGAKAKALGEAVIVYFRDLSALPETAEG